MYVTFHGFNVIILYTEFFMLANVTGTELGLPRPRTTYLDFTLTKTFDHHKMATSHDGKSLLLNHGGKMKSVKRVNNQRFVSVLLSVLLIRSPDNLAIQKYTIINVSSISVCFELSYIYIFMLQGDFVRVRKKDLDKLTTEVMQLREFLPRVLNRDLIEALHKARTAQTSIYIITIIVTSSKVGYVTAGMYVCLLAK